MNLDIPNGISGGGINRDIKNLSSIVKSAKFKKSNFVKVNLSKIDFLTSKAREAFIYLQKAFTKVLILKYFNLEHYIWIDTDTLGYAISGVPS